MASGEAMTAVVEDQGGSLAARLQRLAGTPVWALTEEQLKDNLAEALRVRAGLDALCAEMLVAVEKQSIPSLEGCTSTSAWLAHLTGVSRHEARRVVAPSEHLTDLVEETRKVWAAGQISTEKATLICKTVTTLPEWVGDAESRVAQSFLLDAASRFSLDDLKRLANHILEVIDPDGAEEHLGKKLHDEEQRARLKTMLTMFGTGEGLTRGRFVLPAAQASMLKSVLEGLASPRRNDPRIYDKDGEHSDAADGRLTHEMRLGRALCELIEHLPSDAMPMHGGLAASMTISMTLDQLNNGLGTATLSTGEEMSAGQARRFACNANLIPVVLDGDSKLLDLGMSKRLFNRYQRTALAKRDRGCCWKGCDRPPSWCESHHLEHYGRGGPTDLDNGALFCFFHHHLLHNGEWHARMGTDGVVEVIPPSRVDPHQRPMRHSRFRSPPDD